MHLKTKNWKTKVKKITTVISTLAVVVNLFVPGSFLIPVPEAKAGDPQMCQVAVDVVLIMDRSGSMAEGENPSKCVWEKLELVGASYQCVTHTDTNITEAWCSTKHVSQCKLPVFTAATIKKITAAKDAATSFVNSMGSGDQSALVSFSDTATLDKSLSTNHDNTKSAINALVTGGSTNIGGAIDFATQEIVNNNNNKAAKAMILLTDGKANRPHGDGYTENTADVNYAISEAQAAAVLGYKIFTIGLGLDGEINETMLQNIADTTGAKYYHASNGDDLSDIYNQIAFEVCQYGSVSGCKYNDVDNDASTAGIETDEQKLSGWDITLTNGEVTLTQTLTDGCYTFAGLEDDDYTITEAVPDGWVQTYPVGGSHSVTIADHNDVVDMDFANYFPTCGNQILDSGYGEMCEIGNNQSCTTGEGYDGTQGCNDTCSDWNSCVSSETCGDGAKNGSEECDGQDGIDEHHLCTAQCTLEYVPWCGDLITNDGESCDGDEPRACEIGGYTGTESCDACSWSSCQTAEMCGDQTVNGPELCDGSEMSCTTLDGYSGNRTCNGTCDGWNSCLSTESCGDNIKNGSEACDGTDGVTAGFHCTQSCALEADGGSEPICGNDILESGEQCDDSNTADGDGCSSTCQNETPSGPVCGNDAIETGETCDDGNLENGDGCSSACAITYQCSDDVDNDQDSVIDEFDPGCHTDGDVNNSGSYEPTDNDEIDIYTMKAGDLIINEILVNPGAVLDSKGEWFELYNSTNQDLDLNSCVISDLGTESHTITGSLIVPKHGFVVLAKNGTYGTNGGITPNYIYGSSIDFTNSDDGLVLTCDSVEIDRVVYSKALGFPDPFTAGKSMVLSSPYVDNNVGSNWCFSTNAWAAGDKGSPGYENDACSTCTSSLAGKKYNSLEAPMPGWTIQLFNSQETLITSTTTDDSGNYSFGKLCLGDYKIKEVLKSGWAQMSPTENDGAYLQSILEENTNISGLDFMNVEYGSIAGYKFKDDDGDVLTTADQTTGLENWTINLFKNPSETALATTTTDSAGHFQFTNLLPGEYLLTEILLTDWTQLSSPATITLTAGLVSENNNFINYYAGGQGGEEPVCGNSLREGLEICDGTDGISTGFHCTSLCTLEADQTGGGGGGGGGGNADVCGDGILNETTEQCDGIFGTPEGYSCTNLCQLQKNEVISAPEETGGTGGGPTEETGTGGAPGEIGGGLAIVSPIVAGEATKEPEQETPEIPNEIVLGASTSCPLCGWPSWVLAAILLAGNIALYYYIFYFRLNSAKGDDQKA